MEFVWIRHGMTEGNRSKKYIGGQTDEGLCKDGEAELFFEKERGLYPQVDIVYVSPMRRCLETADILYPDVKKQVVEGFRECDFGMFENKNAQELEMVAEYQEWLLGNGQAAFPGGESPQGFCERSVRALLRLLEKEKVPERAAFVVHGGTIMAVFSTLDEEKKGFYDYHVENGSGYFCKAMYEEGKLKQQQCRMLEKHKF